MGDLAELLEQAAPRPTRDVDLDRALRDASRARRRRRAAVAVAVLVPIGAGALAIRANHGTRRVVVTVPSTESTVASPPPTTSGPPQTGAGLVAVPSVVAMTQQAATSALESLGLVVEPAPAPASLPGPRGVVVGQDPQPRAQVAAGSTVRIFIGNG